MKIGIFKENKLYSLKEVFKDYIFEEQEKILKGLIELKLIKKISKISDLELEDLLDIDRIKIEKGDILYRFTYVGMISIEDNSFIIYPKYLKDETIEKERINNYIKLKEILKVIRKYNKSKEQEQFFLSDDNSSNFNLITLVLELLEDYYQNGLYFNEERIIELNGEGEILWNKTINENIAYFNSSKKPIYLDFYTSNSQINEEDFFRRLHSYILTDSCQKVETLLNILDVEPVNISTQDLEDFGDANYILYRLNNEENRQFITRKKKVLEMLKVYILKKENSNKDNNISFVGVNSFNLVWEKVCSVVLNNSLNKTLKELSLSHNDNRTLLEIIDKPKWRDRFSGNEYEKDTLKPDTVIVSNIANKELEIYDAKYYNIDFSSEGIKGQPGIGDITKQYLYELAYLKKGFNIIKNAFLMPVDNETETDIYLGEVNLELFNILLENGYKLKPIEVILKPCSYMYQKYLKK